MDAGSLSVFGVPLAFLSASLLIELTPGPNMSYLAVLTLGEGRRAGLAAVASVGLGLLAAGFLAALGLAALINQSPVLYSALRWGGVIYLLWLAFETWTGRDGHPSETTFAITHDWRYFRRGLITNLLNPKAAVFYLTVLPLFLDQKLPTLAQTMALTVAYAFIATSIHALIVMLAASARPLLEDQTSMQTVRRVLALALAGIALWVLWSTRA